MNIEKVLKQHLENKSRISVLKIKIEKAREELKLANITFKEDERDVIEALQISAVTVKNMPTSKSNGFNSAVENTVLTYHQELICKNNIDVDEIYSNINVWEKEKTKLETETATIEAALCGLTAQEQFVIKMYYFEKLIGSDLQLSFERNFRYKDQETIRELRSNALKKLEKLTA
ncbi:MAG TPA: hypothetical protein VIK78_00235 [Ruminiclostridium sp.]